VGSRVVKLTETESRVGTEDGGRRVSV
jgi:hypothetical protein